MLSNQDFGQEDSSLTRIAVLPILQSLPIYYAERTGMLGSQMCLKRYNAQMDIDTAITNKHVDIAQTDIIKAIQLCEKQNSVTSIWSFYDDMGTSHVFGMEPPIVASSEFESKLIILEVVFSNINIIAITGNIVEWF